MPDGRSDVVEPALMTDEPGSRPRRRVAATLLSLAISVALLAVLYSSLNLRLVGEALVQADVLWLVVSVGMIVPITLLRSLRFFWVTPAGALPGLAEALRLTVVASALNVFLPAKSGDLIKSYFVARGGQVQGGVAVSIIVYERLSDLFGMIAWCLLGWVLGRPQIVGVPDAFWVVLAAIGFICFVLIASEPAAVLARSLVRAAIPGGKLRALHDLADGWPGLLGVLRGRRRWIVSYSLGLWLTHLFQIWLFTIALGVDIPFTVCASLSAVALMAGQIPLTFAGLGTRDVALVVLLARYMTPELAAAMGVLISTRGLLPPLMGLPVMRPYLSSALADARRWRQEAVRQRPA